MTKYYIGKDPNIVNVAISDEYQTNSSDLVASTKCVYNAVEENNIPPDGTSIKVNNNMLTWNTVDVSPFSEKYQTLGDVTGSKAINLNNGLAISATITGATTFSFTDVPQTGATVVVMQLTNGGAHTITWPSSIKWSGGTAPKFTASGIDIVVLTTNDAGATWYGIVNLKYA